ncbi:MAG TPA: Hsp20/alpha crystallin family protein [Candidatus Hydrogenedentes bacterium]|nr:Hsp20/alpha crystallin family protein [Candidatus Hydrogenedentota bacterium]
MALVRWRNRGELAPWSALRDIEGQFNRLFAELAGEGDWRLGAWSPAVDLTETDEAYTLEADLPGLNKDDVEITAVDNVITLKGERKQEHEAREKGHHRYERRYGSFQRSFEVPGGFEAEKVDAKFEDGVLRVTLPKRKEAKPKHIQVKFK